MKLARIFRDLAILGVVGCVFYFVVQAASVFKRVEPTRSSQYSDDRRLADELYRDEMYREAIPYLDRLIEDDPFNSYAINRKAYAAYEVFRTSLADQNDETEIDKFATLSLNTYNLLMDYPRYANGARFRMAVIHSRRDDDEKALAILDEAVESGFYSRRGLANYDVFQKYRQLPEFRRIMRLEYNNQESYRIRRQGNVRVRGG